ncbi:unnamed protein product [Polarella glacialis]|uniref:Uncharacterized protein n=1 Tax=Polarella glacialis TaxID=89957 RepID=A0A813E6M8_POLGL|nr:unnamed protein product [Polarella glacialis]
MSTWSTQKKNWCCNYQQQGCFDCNAGFKNWVLGWSTSKKQWCCQHEDLTCFDCQYSPNWRTAWSDAKQKWCCKKTGLTCSFKCELDDSLWKKDIYLNQWPWAVDWIPTAEKELKNRNVVLHTDGARAYQLNVDGMLHDHVVHMKKKLVVNGKVVKKNGRCVCKVHQEVYPPVAFWQEDHTHGKDPDNRQILVSPAWLHEVPTGESRICTDQCSYSVSSIFCVSYTALRGADDSLSPCSYFHFRPDGCRKAHGCTHCHFCTPEQARARMHQIRTSAKAAKEAARLLLQTNPAYETMPSLSVLGVDDAAQLDLIRNTTFP